MDSGSSSSSGSSSASQSTGTDRLAGKQLRLVLEDEFNGDSLDKSKWNQEVTLWGGGVSIAIFFVNITEQESQWFVPTCVSFLGFWVILLIVFGFWCKGIGV